MGRKVKLERAPCELPSQRPQAAAALLHAQVKFDSLLRLMRNHRRASLQRVQSSDALRGHTRCGIATRAVPARSGAPCAREG